MGQQNDLVHEVPGSRTGRKGLTGTSLMTAAAIGVVGCIVIVPLSYYQQAASLAFAQLVAATLGLWMLPCVFPLVFLRRPGTTLMACLVMGVISTFTTSYGPLSIATLAIEGLLLELPFLVTGYRKWTRAQFIVSALLLGTVMGCLTAQTAGIVRVTTVIVIENTIIADVSCLVFLRLTTQLARALRNDLGGSLAAVDAG